MHYYITTYIMQNEVNNLNKPHIQTRFDIVSVNAMIKYYSISLVPYSTYTI